MRCRHVIHATTLTVLGVATGASPAALLVQGNSEAQPLRKMHSLLLSIDLLDDGHASDLFPVLPKAGPQVLKEAPVDVVDDLHVARQQALHQTDWPLL